MNKSILLLCYLSLCTLQLYAQYPLDIKRGNRWYLGDKPSNAEVDFNTSPPSINAINANINFAFISSSVCDTSGNMLLYSNGMQLLDYTGQTIINGDSIVQDSTTKWWYELGSCLPNTMVILPSNSADTVFWVLYKELETIQYSIYIDLPFQQKLNYGQIKKRPDGRYQFYKSTENLVTSSVLSGILTIRHANGRDWWIIVAEANQIRTYLLTSNHLLLSSIFPFAPNTYERIVYSSISMNGDKIIFTNAAIDEMQRNNVLLDFDRCTGTVNNQRIIVCYPTIGGFVFGANFSPSGRYLYLNDEDKIVQYDTWANDIQNSGIVIGLYDGVSLNTNGHPLQFHTGYTAPDGKIYISTAYGDNTYSVINNPDSAGLACNFQPYSVQFPCEVIYTMPSAPNYHLGPIDGSTCDSLGIDNIVTAIDNALATNSGIKVYPNPTNGQLQIEGNVSSISIYNITGQLIINTSSKHLLLNNIPKGVYILLAYDKNKAIVHREKLIIN